MFDSEFYDNESMEGYGTAISTYFIFGNTRINNCKFENNKG